MGNGSGPGGFPCARTRCALPPSLQCERRRVRQGRLCGSVRGCSPQRGPSACAGPPLTALLPAPRGRDCGSGGPCSQGGKSSKDLKGDKMGGSSLNRPRGALAVPPPVCSRRVLVCREGAGTEVPLSIEKRELSRIFVFFYCSQAQRDQVSYPTRCNAKSRDKHSAVSRRFCERCKTNLPVPCGTQTR